MKITILQIFLVSLIVGSVYSQLLFPQPKKMSLKKTFFKNYWDSNKADSNITTQCNNVNITEYNGVTLSGYLNVGIQNSSSALGFIFFGAKGLTPTQFKNRPTLIWLNGGPGCSSQFGNFYELGPLKIFQNTNGEFNFTKNEYAWSNEYNVIFIDQPIGTGISIAEKNSQIPVNQTEVAIHFYSALIELYEKKNGCFYELGIKPETSPLFIYGESYAGKYIPSIAEIIVQKGNKFNLKGIGIGDGFTSPYYNIQAVNQFAYSAGLININQYQENLPIVQAGQKAINDSQWDNASAYFSRVLRNCNPKGANVYNINNTQEIDSSALENLFNSKYGQKLFSIQLNKEFEQCDGTVQLALSIDFMQNDCVKKVEYLLENGIHVHVFNGDLDLIVPYTSPQLWLSNLKWSGIEQFKSTATQIWKSQNSSKVYGSIQQYDNLTFNIVFNSGHMVPEDQPEVSLSMIKQVIEYTLIKSSYKVESFEQ